MSSFQNKNATIGNGLKHRGNEFIKYRGLNFFEIEFLVDFITTGKNLSSSTIVGLLIEVTITDVYVTNEIYEIMETTTSGCEENDENQI